MRKIKLIVIVPFFICIGFAGVVKADAYLEGFQALEQKDYKTALYFLSMFAANGDARANYNLGVMYREGFGVEQDDIEALTRRKMAICWEIMPLDWLFCAGEEVM